MVLGLKRNVGNTDRLIRTLIAIILVALVGLNVISSWWSVVALIFAGLQLVEATLGY